MEFFSLETLKELAQVYGYWAVFFGIALENMGIPLPGETITIAGGFLAGSGELSYEYVLGSAIAGAILGDNFGYWLGRTGGWSLLLAIGRWFRLPQQQIERVRDRFAENAAKAVFFGRFVTLLRIFAGPLAGIARMPYPQFLLFNFGGAALWASVMVSLAYFLGRLFPLPTIVGWVGRFGILALVAIVMAIALPLRQETHRNNSHL